jgi:hypothetical protein
MEQASTEGSIREAARRIRFAIALMTIRDRELPTSQQSPCFSIRERVIGIVTADAAR